VVIVGMKSRKPPESGNIPENEGKLVAAEENVECGFVIEAVVEVQAHVFVLLDDRTVIVGAVKGADEIETVAGIGGDF